MIGKNVSTIVESYLEATLCVGQDLETGWSPFFIMESSVSLMKSQCLSCFMIFYLREGRVGPMRGVGPR